MSHSFCVNFFPQLKHFASDGLPQRHQKQLTLWNSRWVYQQFTVGANTQTKARCIDCVLKPNVFAFAMWQNNFQLCKKQPRCVHVHVVDYIFLSLKGHQHIFEEYQALAWLHRDASKWHFTHQIPSDMTNDFKTWLLKMIKKYYLIPKIYPQLGFSTL